MKAGGTKTGESVSGGSVTGGTVTGGGTKPIIFFVLVEIKCISAPCWFYLDLMGANQKLKV